ncbi:hypothetical protein B296_00015194 [Ensete ventricosum]|uniref:Uncharacterized protein n=1 Tax=Ensete ventricosum TaxID=4639 RepID=A0A427AZS1_ENSVE|nr:hypothetical protein B296_00015194 [Ensete ventricosum]
MDSRAMSLAAPWYRRGGTSVESSIPCSHGGRALVVKQAKEVENAEANSKYEDKAEGRIFGFVDVFRSKLSKSTMDPWNPFASVTMGEEPFNFLRALCVFWLIWITSTAGAIGGVAASLIRVPTEVVKQRMQTGQFTSAPNAVHHIVAKEGIRGLYAAGRELSDPENSVIGAFAVALWGELNHVLLRLTMTAVVCMSRVANET